MKENIKDLLTGKREVEVVFLDPETKEPENDIIFVHVIPFLEPEKLDQVAHGTPVEAILISCPKLTPARLSNISKESFFKLHAACLELNMPEYLEWVKHQRAISEQPAMKELASLS